MINVSHEDVLQSLKDNDENGKILQNKKKNILDILKENKQHKGNASVKLVNKNERKTKTPTMDIRKLQKKKK